MLTILAAVDFDSIIDSIKATIGPLIEEHPVATFVFIIVICWFIGAKSKRR